MDDEEMTSTPSSGNVFADLDLPEPEALLAKTELVRQVSVAIRERGLTQSQAAEVLGVEQPRVVALQHGHLADFSIESLLRFLLALDRDVEIAVRPKQAERAHVRVA